MNMNMVLHDLHYFLAGTGFPYMNRLGDLPRVQYVLSICVVKWIR